MNILSIIEKKKLAQVLTDEEIAYFVDGYVKGAIPDYQMAALLMAIRLNGMTDEETACLTLCMAGSGAQIDLSGVDGVTVDKHSTGGVSDATTFVVVPILAELGFKVAKMSGRGLGFTGGTIDKLECFSGYRVEQSQEDFIRIANTVGASVVGATSEVAPADKKLYALRDVTGTVDSIPLIASSIMSKKLAAGASVIMLDVKYGDGAFMKKLEDARTLARTMVAIGNCLGRRTGALVTSMQEPLGRFVGGNPECVGALRVLAGERNDLYLVARALVRGICRLAGKTTTDEEIDGIVDSGRAYARFCAMIAAHGGTVDESKLTFAPAYEVLATKEGVVSAVAARTLGEINCALGGGRRELGDGIDHEVGLEVCVRIGDTVRRGDTLCRVFARSEDKELLSKAQAAFTVAEKAQKPVLIADEIF